MIKVNKDFCCRALEVFVKNSPEMVFIKDISLRYVMVSDSFADMVGKSPKDIEGKNDFELFDAALAKKYTDDDRKVLSTGIPMINDIEPLLSLDGKTRFSSTSKFTICDKQGNIIGLIGAGRDITQQLSLADEANKANAAKSEFLSRMSHDMRTPMNGILGMLDITLEMDLPDEVRSNLEKIKSSGKYMVSLVNDTLDMSKIESNRMEIKTEPTDSRKYMESIISALKLSADEKNIDFAVNIKHTQFVPIMIDRVRVQQIMINIISNAIKFTPAGGVIELTVEELDLNDESATVRFVARDSGIGMSEDFLKNKLFKPFEQENTGALSFAGSGLGMSIVKKLVDLMGGTISVSSVKGKGTTFVVVLTFKRCELAEETEPLSKEDFYTLNGKNILVCEDHPLNAEIARILLQKAGCSVSLAANGHIGINKFRESGAYNFDAILMDIRMPMVDGLEAAATIRSLDCADAKTIPIVAMTANAFDDDVEKSMQAGMNAHLTKPIDAQTLYRTLSELL